MSVLICPPITPPTSLLTKKRSWNMISSGNLPMPTATTATYTTPRPRRVNHATVRPDVDLTSRPDTKSSKSENENCGPTMTPPKKYE